MKRCDFCLGEFEDMEMVPYQGGKWVCEYHSGEPLTETTTERLPNGRVMVKQRKYYPVNFKSGSIGHIG